MNELGLYLETGFFELFWDAAWFARQSSKNRIEFDHCDVESKFARASIINAALCLECAANCCIETLRGQFKVDTDKLPSLSKFDCYLLFRGKSALDRGNKHVQPIAEIVQARNDYVHRKVKKRKSQFLNSKVPVFTLEAAKVTNILKLCEDPSEWNAEDAARVLRALTDFFNFYFLECCQHSPREVRALLCGGPRGFDVKTTVKDRLWTPREIKALLKKKIISLKFVGE